MTSRISYVFLIIAMAFLSACDGDTRPFTEAVEVRNLNLQSISVLPPESAEVPIFLNKNEQIQLRLQGTDSTGNAVAISQNDRDWQVDNASIATITGDGHLTALQNGAVNVFVTVGGIRSENFLVTVSDATLVAIDSISGPTTLRACVPGEYFARGLFSDDSLRTLAGVNFRVDDQSSENISVRNSTTELATVTGFVPGDYSLTAERDSITSDSILLIVPDTLTGITVSPATGTLAVGATLDLTAQGAYSSNESGEPTATSTTITESVLWQLQTSNGTASVSNQAEVSGRVTGLAAGNASLQASCGAVVSNASNLVITATNDSDLVFNITGPILNLVTTDNTFELRVATGTTYSSSNDVSSDLNWSFVNSVSSTVPIRLDADGNDAGNITPLNAGTAVVTATRSSDNASLSITVVVRDP